MTAKGDLLLVEGDAVLLINNKIILERCGYTVRLAKNLAEARTLFEERHPNVLVLDILLPDGRGLDYLREIRRTSNIPVLLLATMREANDVITCLDAGGDDYLSIPYNFSELRARVDALMRRTAFIPEKVERGTLELHLTSAKGFLDGQDMQLTHKEFLLLLLLIRHEGKLLSMTDIYEKIWELPIAQDKSAVKNTVYKLRNKLCDSGYEITNERNDGYCLKKNPN
ncbi:MAG: response regulator transcription factor [Clostridiales Family XIII bacterium]|jgi:DNA-binding response OmpR family regulator|nr:response regulator transcription factor [Clostridiales Family XIII bacterium]